MPTRDILQAAGNTYFFTVRLLDPGSTLLTEHFPAFGEAIRHARAKKPFSVDAWVVLPNHVHSIWTLPEGDSDFASRWRAVKIGFSKALRKSAGTRHAGVVWEPLFMNRQIEDAAERQLLVDYIHTNPQRHGLCAQPEDWPWSSIHRSLAPPPEKKKGPQALSR
jgi:putative transposase